MALKGFIQMLVTGVCFHWNASSTLFADRDYKWASEVRQAG